MTGRELIKWIQDNKAKTLMSTQVEKQVGRSGNPMYDLCISTSARKV